MGSCPYWGEVGSLENLGVLTSGTALELPWRLFSLEIFAWEEHLAVEQHAVAGQGERHCFINRLLVTFSISRSIFVSFMLSFPPAVDNPKSFGVS